MSGTEADTQTFETPSFASHLKTDSQESASEPSKEVTEKSEPKESEQPASEVPSAEKPAEAPKVEPPAPAAPTGPQNAGLGFVPIAAVQAERAKRQELEAKLREIEAGIYPTAESAPPAQADIATIERDLRRDLSEQMARKMYSDYDEKVAEFASEVYDMKTGQIKNQRLYEEIANSPLPAEAAYRAGVSILEAKKLGGWDVVSDPVKYRQAIEKEIRANVEKEIRAQIESEIVSKVQSKSKTITDITQARAASGATESEFRVPTMSELLSRSNRKR